MKVTGWTDWDDHKYIDAEHMNNGDYQYAKTVIAGELRDRGYKFSGHYHQFGERGAPIIDDSWIFRCSQRTWGGIMLMAYPDEIDDSDGYGYVKWAWNIPYGEEMVAPEHPTGGISK